jgi:predicted metal-dependent hydrolase
MNGPGPDPSEEGILRDRRLAAYVRLFNDERFFEAHEVLEDLWLAAPEDFRDGLQGLVQIAVALEHHRRGNRAGARTVLERARRRLAGAAGRLFGIDLDSLVREASAHIEGRLSRPPRIRSS